MQQKNDGIRIVVGEEHPHKCETKRHIEDLAHQTDRLETKVDSMIVDVGKRIHSLELKLVVTYAVTSLLAYKVLGVTLSIFGL